MVKTLETENGKEVMPEGVPFGRSVNVENNEVPLEVLTK